MNKFKSLSILFLLLFSAFSMKIRTTKEGGTEGVAGAVQSFLHKLDFNMVEVVHEQLSKIARLLGNDCNSKESGSLSFSAFRYTQDDIWR